MGRFALTFAAIVAAMMVWHWIRYSGEVTENRGYLGVSYQPLSPERAKLLGASQGVMVTEVLPGSTAESAGVLPGDVIVKVDDRPIAGEADFILISRKWTPKQTLKLHLLRQAYGGAKEVVIESALMTSDQAIELRVRAP